MKDTHCMYCLIARQAEAHHPGSNDPTKPPDLLDNRKDFGRPIEVIYSAQGMCVPHFNLMRGCPMITR